MSPSDAAPKWRRVGAALLASLGLLWGALALAYLGGAIEYFGSPYLVAFLGAMPTALSLLAAAGLWGGTSPTGRRIGAAICATLGLLWGAFALYNLGGLAYIPVLYLCFIALAIALPLLAAVGLWVGTRWAWIVAALAIVGSVGLAGLFLAVAGSE